MEEIQHLIATIVERHLPLDLVFDGAGAACAGRLLEVRRVGDADGLAIEVTSGDPPRDASVVRVRTVIDRNLYEFAVLIARRTTEPMPLLLTRYPSDIHTVERRRHPRVLSQPTVRMRVALTVSGEWIPVDVHNLSEGGAAFSSPHVGVFVVGHTVARVELTLDDGPPIVTSAMVKTVYTIRYPREVGPVYGIAWGRVSADERARLKRHISRAPRG